MSYPWAVKPNYVKQEINLKAVTLGAPKLADSDWIVVDRAMAVATFTKAHTTAGDGLPRNITVKATQAGGVDDEPGIVTITGLDAAGDAISEEIIPLNGSTVAGELLFASVATVAQSAWVAGGTADRIEVGFGTKVGLTADFLAGAEVVLIPLFCLLGASAVGAPDYALATVPSEAWVDLSGSTYDGVKHLTVIGLYTAA